MKKFNNKIYFNYGGFGPISYSLYRNLNKFIWDYYNFGPPDIIKKYKIYIRELKSELTKMLNCQEKEICYIKNTTEGVILASEVLPIKKGDEILILEGEYSANLIPWLKKKKDGYRVNIVKGSDNETCFKNLEAAINSRTKVISISWVQYYDGYMVDLRRISKICKDKNIFLVVDAIQGIGTRRLNLKKIKIDTLVCGGHKHLLSVAGAGFMYVNKNIMHDLNSYKVGTRSVKNFDLDGYELKSDSERFEDGTPNLFGILSLYHSVKHINKIGIGSIEKKNLDLLRIYKNLLKENNISFIDYKIQGNIISIPMANPKKICKILENKNIYTKAIKDVLRISFGYKNSVVEFKTLIKEMNRLRIGS